ncbi:unnamed protein product [Durusdinium trenchii]|uniref:Uncharacterized protein n=1 Tax=Durusdinium trenchii TaxID=1381693 RepID=A0ABP0J5X2_9DINO
MGMNQLIPDRPANPQDAYRGPVALLKEAYEETESLGSTTILLAVLDNSTRVHGKLHPMVAVLTIGDCEMLMMRRLDGLQAQTFSADCQDRVDPEFDEELALEVSFQRFEPVDPEEVATQPVLLSHLARRLVDEAHAKSEVGLYGLPDTPIGLGGKMDDTSVVVGEVVEWTKAHSEVWAQVGCAPLSPMVKDVLQGGSLQP